MPLDQMVFSIRGVSKGRHEISVLLETVAWGCSVGIAPRQLLMPYPAISDRFLMLYMDGSVWNIHELDQKLREKGRVKDQLKAGDVVTVLLDLTERTCGFRVNGVMWSVVENVCYREEDGPFHLAFFTKVSSRNTVQVYKMRFWNILNEGN